MAQVQITHACGHAETHHLFGRRAERDRKEQWLAGRPCAACWQAQKQADREAESVAAESWAAATKLPVLEGSERQCAWAETLRKKDLDAVCRELTDVFGRLPEGHEARAFAAAVTEDAGRLREAGVFADWLDDDAGRDFDDDARLWVGAGRAQQVRMADVLRAVAWLAGQADAKWWIDERYLGADQKLLRHIEEPERQARQEAERLRREAQERAAKARREEEAKVALAAAQEKARQDALAAIEKKKRLHELQRDWLRRLSELIGHEPSDLILIRAKTNYGWRVLVNEGSDRYAREHLIDYRPAEGVLKTCRELVSKKKELLPFCIDFWALNPNAETSYSGKALFAEESEAKS